MKRVSPKRVSRYRVPSCLPLSLEVRMGCEGNGGGVQESLKFLHIFISGKNFSGKIYGWQKTFYEGKGYYLVFRSVEY